MSTSPNQPAGSTHKNELMDSLLHSNVKRVIMGGICGLLSGCVLLFLTTFFTPAGAGKLWWIQLMASIFYGGEASVYDVPSSILIAGAVWYFGMSLFLGVLYGKMTTSKSLGRLLAYGLVLGGLCWLASNMFAPDLFNLHALAEVKQWTRMFLFQSFTLSLALFMSFLG